MANTLSLGSGNWGAKDSLLLGYYEDGTQFLPETFDVTRATGGTRVNKAGLIETPAEIGSELVVNGNFATDSDWTLGTGWTISGGTANYDGLNAYQLLRQGTINAVVGKTYILKYDVSNNSGSGGIYAKFGGVNLSGYNPSNGSYEFYIVAVSTDYIRFTPQLNFTGSIDNVSVKEYNDKNIARIDYLDDAKGALLTEPQSTNLIIYSEDFSNSGWSKLNVSLIGGFTSPSGNLTAYKSTTTAIYQPRVEESITIPSVQTKYSFSVFVKKSNTPYVALVVYNGSSDTSTVFNLDTKSIVSTTAENSSIKEISNGWFRISMTKTIEPTANNNIWKIVNSNGVNPLVGVIGDEVLIWGAQLEAVNALGYNGEYATSYIPTFNGIVSRNKDEVNNGGDVNTFGSEGVLYAEIAALANDVTSRSLSLSSGSYSNRIELRYDSSSNGIRVFGVVGGVFQFDSSTTITLTDITKQSKLALKYKENDFALWVNGVEVYSDLSGSVFAEGVLNKLSFSDAQGASPFYGKTKNIQVFNTALSDSDLLSLTTTGSVPYWTQYSAMATTLNYTNK